ncbi:LysR family transcriptional regulator [Dehalobacter sp.]|uniref:LysR family transcriptional regulator n=1 Tax=Dehalobacter sp. TaxID=1962289 RepID=UPI0002DC0C0A|nr:LysR family transcriptional regulator [Dehalobacter sp.]MCG1025191.1 LysR family transcriptional regulator [Dehalobacter sp.]MDJ0304889.1 LysR family transcriptional regulator [Dehalobacter sp.]
MDIRQLRYFRTIVEKGQITLAAKALNIAQPPLSQQLKQLEDELGTSLIIRDSKHWEITEAGILLYQRAVEMMNLMEDTKKEVKEFRDGIRGTLLIGSSSTCVSLLPGRIKLLQDQYPKLYFKLLLGDSRCLEELLEKRSIEVALLLLPVKSKEIKALRLPKEPFVVVIPSDWSIFFPEDTISLQDIVTYPFLLLRRIEGRGLYEEILEKFNAYGLMPDVIFDCSDISTLLTLVTLGVGLTLVPKFSISPVFNEKIKILHIKESFLEKEPAVVWIKDRYLSKVTKKFLETFSE